MTNETTREVYRLAPKKKKGILALIFSRFLLIALLLVLEVAMVAMLVVVLDEMQPVFILVERVFAIGMMIYLFSNSMDFSAKTTWMFIMMLAPFPGALLLLFTQTDVGHRRIKSKVASLIEETRESLPQDPAVRKALREDGGDVDDLVTYLNRSGCFPAFDGTESTFFPSGEEKFQAMLEELRKAEKYIFMEYFIIEEGYMWGEILRILVEKAAAGVEVRVMYDGMCEMSTLPVNYCKRLEEKGIKAKSFSPIRPVLSSHYNYRDHRKILVIDGQVGFTGGVNLADEYINEIERFGHWKDTAVMLKGPAVESFTLMFLQMWNITEQETDFQQWLPEGKLPEGKLPAGTAETGAEADAKVDAAKEVTVPAPAEADPASAGFHPSGYVVPFCDCPLDEDKVGEAVYMDILNRAGTYVHIMTPYLILDGQLETSLKFAAERGIDVRLILPGIPDKKMAYALAKSHYSSLVASGVKIYEYTPGFVHAKICVSDDERAVVGTINFDYRSLYHHFECGTLLYKTDSVTVIEEDFQKTLAECRAVTPESIRNESTFYKVMGTLMKFVAPLM